MEMIEQLICYGLTRQEATIYISLLTEGELSGYEAAKVTGISRSNTYNALAGLVDKGAAYLIEGSVAKYTPVMLDEFCNNKIHTLEEMKKNMMSKMPRKREETEGYITIKGKQHIFDKMRNMIREAKKRVYVFMSSENLHIINDELNELINKNIKVVIVTERPFEMEGAIVYFTKPVDNQIRIIVDTKKVLTGDVTEEEYSTCLFSKNKNLVDVFKEMLKNEIRLIEITKE